MVKAAVPSDGRAKDALAKLQRFNINKIEKEAQLLLDKLNNIQKQLAGSSRPGEEALDWQMDM